jgi:hypothetical protein
MWTILHVVFMFFGKRIHNDVALMGGEWAWQIFPFVLQLETNHNYNQRKFSLFYKENGITYTLFDESDQPMLLLWNIGVLVVVGLHLITRATS